MKNAVWAQDVGKVASGQLAHRSVPLTDWPVRVRVASAGEEGRGDPASTGTGRGGSAACCGSWPEIPSASSLLFVAGLGVLFAGFPAKDNTGMLDMI